MQITSSIWFLALIVICFGETAEPSPPFLPIFTRGDIHEFETPNARPKEAGIKLNYRLPNETYPEHYDIKLTTNVDTGERAFQGEVIIDIVVAKATNNIVLHARKLEISKVTIANPLSGESEELSYMYELEREFLTLTHKNNRQFVAETIWKLTITYSGKLRNDNGGFYLSTYIDNKGNTHYFAATQFESTEARHGFPCYDEPDKRANFTVTINHSPNYTAISNMPVNEALSSAGKTVFLTTARIPTYIVAFIVSDFHNTEGVLNGLPQHIYSRLSGKNDHEWALTTGMLVTERLSEYYGVKFMLPKMDHVAVPNFAAGGMENWGLATYREEILLYDKSSSTVFKQTQIALVMAHEIAHQWFGDYVAIKWWTYLWLKEGFANLFSYRALDDTYPEWGVWQDFHVSSYQLALTADGKRSPRSMTHYVQKPTEISGLYDSVSYSKAGSVLAMWSNALTDKVFQQGLRNYLTINQYSAAVEEQLFTAIQIATKEENYDIPARISEMFSSWTRQGGYPMLTVTRNYRNGTFIVKQEAFHSDETIKNNKTWYVPINYADASNPDFRDTEATHYLLNVTEMQVDNVNISKTDWLILNKQSTGYYRIKYDVENYNLITESLIQRPFTIHPRNRAQLMDDAFIFSASNRLDHAILLKMLTYLKKEDEYAPWTTADGILSTYNHYLNGDVNYEALKHFMADQVSPIFEKLGIDDVVGEHHYRKFTRNIAIKLACLAGVKYCLEETNKKLKALVTRNIAIEPNLRTVIYCNGLRQSGDEEFYFMYNKLMDSTDPDFRRLLISSLGCSVNESHIKKFIYSSIDESNKLRPQERYRLLNPLYSRGEVGLLASIEFLSEHWNEYGNLNQIGLKPLDMDIRRMASYVTNKNQEEKLSALVAKVKNSQHVTATLETYVNKTISNNFEWLQSQRNPLMSWLGQYRMNRRNGASVSATASTVLVLSAFVIPVIRLF